jgi:PERQ amino acid-rich with GYF domain-containing protein
MPNFDGVLNNGDSWASRRRASEASLKSGAATYRDSGGDWEYDDKNSGIREEKEEEVGAESERRTLSPLVTSLAAEHTQSENRSDLYPSSDAFDSELRGQSQSHLGYSGPLDPLGGTVKDDSFSDVRDLAGVEWSYKDPTGQVQGKYRLTHPLVSYTRLTTSLAQGPFRADLMQKWYDDGYFSVDLPMKRTHLDSQWITVEELAKLAGGDKIFLSPFVPALPPGLSLQNGSPLQPLHSIANQNVFSHPYQPAPVRSLRSSTLDSYLGSGSNPSDSPSSSFGTGRFGDSSPDPSSFGGRESNNIYFGGDSAGLGYSATPDTGPIFASRRPSHDYVHDPALALHSPSFGNTPVGQGPLLDVYERVGGYAPAQGPWSQDTFGAEPTIMVSSSTFNSLSNRPTIIPSNSLPGGHRAHQIHGNGDAGKPPNALREGKHTHGPSNTILDHRLLSHSPVEEYLSAQQPETLHRIRPDSMAFTLPSGSQGASPIIAQVATPGKSVQEESQSRPGPFEVPHPTSTNTISAPATHAQPPPWGRGSHISRPSSQSKEPSPWVVASQGILEDPWKDPEPSGLTVSNGGQHNQQHEGPECPVVSPKETPGQIISSQGILEPVRLSEDLSVPTIQSKIITPIQQSHSKPTTSQVAESPTPTPKVAWVKEEEKKKSRAPGVSLSLREIQEAEAKKAESRKAAERERERAARGSTTVDGKEDVQPFTTSWGLPTSQTGARGGVSVKEAAPTVSAAPNNITLPVWTTALKPPVAKTMKEIQEEEEKRKKLAIKETTATAAAKRVYADSTAKVRGQFFFAFMI